MESPTLWIPHLHLGSKFRIVKDALKKWVKEDFEELDKQKINLQRELTAMQYIMEEEEVSPKHLKQEKELNIIILKAARQIEEVWRIKSRQTWLKRGDNNTEYFHKQTKVHQSYNVNKELKDNHGNRITGQEDLKDQPYNHFQ